MKNYRHKSDDNTMGYTHQVLEGDILDLKKKYNFLDLFYVGNSVENRKIYILKFGKGPRKILICGGTHACEWITVPVLMKWVNEICQLYVSKGRIYNKSIEELFERSTIHVLPMLNPDGIELQIKGVAPSSPNYETLVKWNNDTLNFSKWKSNIRGVDLNRNFNAKWEEAKKIENKEGIKGPWFELYGGEYPESEPETQAITNYTRQEEFDLVLSYHTQGREIYWSYDGTSVPGAKGLAEEFSRASGYILGVPDENAAYGGYKDWFIEEFKRPGYTIECGVGENPLQVTQFNQIYKDNFELLLIAAWGGLYEK